MSETVKEEGVLSGLIRSAPVGDSEPLVFISERKCAVLQIVARRSRMELMRERMAKFLSEPAPSTGLSAVATKKLTIAATGPTEFWCFGERRNPEAFRAEIAKALGDSCSIFRQSDAHVLLTLSGPCAERVLNKGCAVDFAPGVFPVPGASHTVIETMPALIVKRDEAPTFDVAVARSYGESFLDWLVAAAAEFGYRVDEG